MVVEERKKDIKNPINEGDNLFKTRYIAYINDSNIYLLDTKKDKIYEKKFDSLSQDQIIEEQKFYFELNRFLFSSKIKIPIFGYKIKLILNDSINNLQKNKYKEIFEDYFQKVEFIDLIDILPINKDTMIINISEDYLDFYFLKKQQKINIRINTIIFNNNTFKTIHHFLNTIYIPSNIMLIGNSNEIPKLASKINKEQGISCTYQEKSATFALNEYKNQNTQ